MTYDKVKYNNEFNKQAYDRLNIQVPKGQKKVLEEHWKSLSYNSLNAYINDLIKKDKEERNMELSSEEQFILNRFRYGNDEEKEKIYNLALEIDKDQFKRKIQENKQSNETE